MSLTWDTASDAAPNDEISKFLRISDKQRTPMQKLSKL